jgi:hypothetical protein
LPTTIQNPLISKVQITGPQIWGIYKVVTNELVDTSLDFQAESMDPFFAFTEVLDAKLR